MIRIALFAAVAAIAAGATAILIDRLTTHAEPPVEVIDSRFPEDWRSAPVIPFRQYKRPPSWPPGVPRLSEQEFIAAVTALERLRLPPRRPQPPNAVLSDSQIASMKERLEITPEQEPYWQAVEATLREVVWDRSHGRPKLDAASLERFREAAEPFVATLTAKQRSEIRALAAIVGLRLDLTSSQ